MDFVRHDGLRHPTGSIHKLVVEIDPDDLAVAVGELLEQEIRLVVAGTGIHVAHRLRGIAAREDWMKHDLCLRLLGADLCDKLFN